MTMEAGVEVLQAQAKVYQQPPEAGRGEKWILLWTL